MRRILLALALVGLPALLARADDMPWARPAESGPRPEIFNGRGAERLAAEEVARLDAAAKLLERIEGLDLTAEVEANDLQLLHNEVRTRLAHKLRGMTVMEVRYGDDGRVEVACRVRLREVMEIVTESIRRIGGGRLDETVQRDRRVEHDVVTRDIVVVGRGALPGSPGLKRIRAMRAAEVDCYRQLAEALHGMSVDRTTRTRDGVLDEDHLASRVQAARLAGVRFVDYRFDGDGTCRVRGEVTLRDTLETTERSVRDDEVITRTDVTQHDRVISRWGVGVPRGVAERDGAPELTDRRVRRIGRRVVIE